MWCVSLGERPLKMLREHSSIPSLWLATTQAEWCKHQLNLTSNLLFGAHEEWTASSFCFDVHLFFPDCTFGARFCATFFQGYIIVDVQMDACKNNHIVIIKRKNQVPSEERSATTTTILDYQCPYTYAVCTVSEMPSEKPVSYKEGRWNYPNKTAIWAIVIAIL